MAYIQPTKMNNNLVENRRPEKLERTAGSRFEYWTSRGDPSAGTHVELVLTAAAYGFGVRKSERQNVFFTDTLFLKNTLLRSAPVCHLFV